MRTWVMFRCPIINDFQRKIRETISHKPEPWLTHANLCLENQIISPTHTLIISCLDINGEIIAFNWLSLPDYEILEGWKSYAYLFHVYVRPEFRGLGYGKQGVNIACDFARSLGVDGVSLATDNVELKDRFYSLLGFRPMKSDPWLMKRMFRPQKDRSATSKRTIRSVSHHDLSTVQSICGQSHWIINSEQFENCLAAEVEEEFCDYISMRMEQYIIRGSYHEKPYVCWLVKDQYGNYKQRILFSGGSKPLKNLVNLLPDIADQVKSLPNSQLGKKSQLIDLLNIN